ncbi:MAG: hypothetical protein JST28_15465 [Acidobacteria bacterium]|nr:hypothetical protein [Acidobacteriota bacterium]
MSAQCLQSGDSITLTLPNLQDKPSMLAALNEVVQALAQDRIKRSVAETLISAIKFANRLLTEIAEAGLALYPARFPLGQPLPDPSVNVPARTATREAGAGKRAVALAASADRRKDATSFSASYPSALSESFVDPSLAEVVKEILAQSRDFPRPHQAKA